MGGPPARRAGRRDLAVPHPGWTRARDSACPPVTGSTPRMPSPPSRQRGRALNPRLSTNRAASSRCWSAEGVPAFVGQARVQIPEHHRQAGVPLRDRVGGPVGLPRERRLVHRRGDRGSSVSESLSRDATSKAIDRAALRWLSSTITCQRVTVLLMERRGPRYETSQGSDATRV